MTRLSVNINKVATIRNARGGAIPDIVQFAIDCQEYGAEGITVHPRPDERHIRFQDVLDLKSVVTTEYNIEGYPSTKWLDLVKKVTPHQATLVPDPPNVLTSDTGWDTIEHKDFLTSVVKELQRLGIRVSLFMNPIEQFIEPVIQIGADRIELYTGPYAENFEFNKEKAIRPYVDAANYADVLGIGVNAGHDLSLKNLHYFVENIPSVAEVSIGHALISDALYFGIESTIQRYLTEIQR